MKPTIALALVAALLIYGATARGQGADPVQSADAPAAPPARLDWDATTQAAESTAPAAPAVSASAFLKTSEAPADIDVVDAHWMALTMWGEARHEGETGMRAVGHVIENRRRSGRHGGYATDTVSEAYQFSCWNGNDPNRWKLDNLHRLRPDTVDHRAWEDARLIAAEILEGRSQDPTGGALFYHSVAVAPAWSRGIPPVRRIGSHVFFLAAR